MYKILISGYYGFNNIGDESILRTVVDNLREKLADVEITVLSQDPEQTREQFGVQAARRMIREGRLNFTQIAARLGFQSPHYFSRRFRQATGMSPSEYARSVKMLSELSGVNPDETANNG